jgi:hypothetical protein
VPASSKPGRPATYSDAAVQCCLKMKVLFGLALRQEAQSVEHLMLALLVRQVVRPLQEHHAHQRLGRVRAG